MHGEPSHDPSSVTGTFDELRKAQAFAGMRLCDINEVIDSESWEVVWRLNTRPMQARNEPLQLVADVQDWRGSASRRH